MIIKVKQILIESLKLSLFLVILPSFVFLINNVFLFGGLDIFGIHPRELTPLNLIGIPFSWVIHANFAHLYSNLIVVILLTPIFVTICNKIKISVLCLIVTSGLATWLLGSTNSVHIGESGLIYAMVGYILYYVYLNRTSILIFTATVILSVIASSYLIGILDGLIPKDGISLAAHFGGIVSGVIVSKFFNHRLAN